MPEAWQTFSDRLASPEGKKQMADWSQWGQQAYSWQRDMRDRYPVADAALGLVPYVGAPLAVDDAVNAAAEGKYGKAAWEALGVIPVGKVMQIGGGLLSKLDSMMRATLLRNGRPYHLDTASDALAGAVGGALTGGGAIYAADVGIRQAEADRRKTK